MKSLEGKISGQLLEGYESKIALSINAMNLAIINKDYERARAIQDAGTRLLLAFLPDDPEVSITTETIKKDNVNIPLGIYHPVNSTRETPALLWVHGGGMIAGSYQQNEAFLRFICKTLQCKVVAVDYRLAPEHPYPAAIDDCYEALKWMFTECESLNINPNLIAVGGASAGGNLAAALTFRARKDKLSLIHQLLIYPMLDNENCHNIDEDHPDTPLWTRECNQVAWSAYLKDLNPQQEIPACAAPARAKNLKELPSSTVIVGEIDLFVDESIQYANRLIKSGVSTALHVYPGAYHGFDFLALASDIGQQCEQAVLVGLRGAFNRNWVNI